VGAQHAEGSNGTGAPRERRTFQRWWWWWILVYFAADLLVDAVGEAVWNWLIAVGGYGLTNAVAGFGSAWVLGPVIGTAFILGARMESAHARTMDARRGRPPAPAPPMR